MKFTDSSESGIMKFSNSSESGKMKAITPKNTLGFLLTDPIKRLRIGCTLFGEIRTLFGGNCTLFGDNRTLFGRNALQIGVCIGFPASY